MKRIAVVSPHLDDAVFSVAERMITRTDKGDRFVIVCPIGALPPMEPHHTKYRLLIDEHIRVCAHMGWDFINGEFYDDAVPQGRHPVQAMHNWLDETLNNLPLDEVWFPAGIHHPDHQWVSDEMPWLDDVAMCVYSELPYFALYPEVEHFNPPHMRVKRMDFVPYKRDPMTIGRKKWLCRMYTSQMFSPTLAHDLDHPERLWRIS